MNQVDTDLLANRLIECMVGVRNNVADDNDVMQHLAYALSGDLAFALGQPPPGTPPPPINFEDEMKELLLIEAGALIPRQVIELDGARPQEGDILPADRNGNAFASRCRYVLTDETAAVRVQVLTDTPKEEIVPLLKLILSEIEAKPALLSAENHAPEAAA